MGNPEKLYGRYDLEKIAESMLDGLDLSEEFNQGYMQALDDFIGFVKYGLRPVNCRFCDKVLIGKRYRQHLVANHWNQVAEHGLTNIAGPE